MNLKKINILINKLVRGFEVNISEVDGRFKVTFTLNPRKVIFFDPMADIKMILFHSNPKKYLNDLLKMVDFQLGDNVDFDYVYVGGGVNDVDYSTEIKNAFGRARSLFVDYDMDIIENPNEYNEGYYHQFILTIYRKTITDLYDTEYSAPHAFREDFRMIETKLDPYFIMDIKHVHKTE